MSEIRLPLEYETNIASFMEKIEAQPVINFDDLESFDPIEQLDFEIENYKPLPIPPVSTYDPEFTDKNYRPGCQYESTLRQIGGEPDLEKAQMDAHIQMELLKQKTKDIVSKANVAMPNTFVKPIDYSIDLLVRTHPTLRSYTNQLGCTETDPEYHLYPSKREKVLPKDEVELRNVKKEEDINFVASITKTISGAFINSNDVPTQELPGNFGVRVIETMPTNLRNVFIDQRSNMELGYICDTRPANIPMILDKPDTNDYLTDEESDEAADFEVKVPELDALLTQFEAEDDTIL